jgi:hypothetical protein
MYKNLILTVAFCGCETWFLKLRQGHRLRVYVSRVVRRIFGRGRDGIIRGWEKLHNQTLLNLCCPTDIDIH